MTPEQIKSICEYIGAADGDVTEENAWDKVKEFATAQTGTIGERDTTIATLNARVQTLETEVKTGEKAASKIDPQTLDILAEATEAKLAGLVTAGKITPATSDKLAASLIGPADGRNAYTLSRHVSGTTAAIAAGVLDALAGNEPPPIGERTGRQSMSRQVPDDDKPDAKETAARGARAMSAAGVKPQGQPA